MIYAGLGTVRAPAGIYFIKISLEKSTETVKLDTMELLYENAREGLRILRCYGLDGDLAVPEQVQGEPVTELASYVLSEQVRGREVPPSVYQGELELKGDGILSLSLPESVARVGAYAFYNCFHLRSLSFWSTTEDWGAGVFTGCTGIRKLRIRVIEGRKSCFKEVLSELRQTLDVEYLDQEGRLLARLMFPEYFEESVENTPARIIMREMHGCGHMYRYCFQGTDFSFQEYDRLFPYVKVQEKPAFVTRLALYRLYWPWGLGGEARDAYLDYVREHIREAAEGLLDRGEQELLSWLAALPDMRTEELEIMLQAAAEREDAQAAAFLMEEKRRKAGNARVQSKRTFEL